ncbi:MAG: hypothetical protein VR67_19375 [Peptococcaceae bacterium BRH_c8a]|nr:MAG: hypothetical protein VR67_19375 [Peptococcaceae bacterium BRH_c8a]
MSRNGTNCESKVNIDNPEKVDVNFECSSPCASSDLTSAPSRQATLRPQVRGGANCENQVNIARTDKVQINFNCRGCTPSNCPPSDRPATCPPVACPPTLPPGGACVPLAIGHKPKQSLEAKLAPLISNNDVPSVLAASFFQLARRFLMGQEPANDLERDAFDIFNNLSPEVQRVMNCSVDSFDAIPPSVRRRLFAPNFGGAQPVDPVILAEAVSNELILRTSKAAFDSTECLMQERPGLPRPLPGIEFNETFLTPVICSINGLRTNTYVPSLPIDQYRPDELQQSCTLDQGMQLNCQVLSEPNCPGNSVSETCLRVPPVSPGEAVVLKGFNFFNTEGRVQLRQVGGTLTRDVEAHVCGDVNTPLTEPGLDGVVLIIADCRVQDILTFKVPDNLPDGIYSIQVIMPNNTDIPGTFADEYTSLGLQYIQVLVSPEVNFQIASERLDVPSETDPEFFGSDEVAIRIVTVPVGLDLTPGEMNTTSFRFGDVDSGENRDMSRVLFQGLAGGIAGVTLTIIGFEVDDEDAFQQQIEDFEDAFALVLKSEWDAIAASLGGLGSAVAVALGLGASWAAAIAAAITLAFNFFVALWAPADLIIEDADGFTKLDLANLTSAITPAPAVREYTSNGDIEVKVEPVSKNVQYRERREYVSDTEDSRYQITLRYNRF